MSYLITISFCVHGPYTELRNDDDDDDLEESVGRVAITLILPRIPVRRITANVCNNYMSVCKIEKLM